MKYIIALCLISIILSGDIDASVKYLVENAHEESIGYCSKYVTDALEAGGFNPDRPPAAYQYWSEKRLEKIGYVEIDKPTSFNKGDITVTENTNGHEYGHIAMYSGDQWISDFKQNSEYVYRDQPKVHYYRYVGTNEEIKKPKSQVKAVKPPVHKDIQPVKTIKRPITGKPPIKVKPPVWKPPIKVKPPVIGKPTVHIGKPTYHIGNPSVHSGKPSSYSGNPSSHSGKSHK